MVTNILCKAPSVDVVSCPDPPSGGCGEREKEGLGNNAGWKCPECRNSATGVCSPQLQSAKPLNQRVIRFEMNIPIYASGAGPHKSLVV